MTFDIYTNRVPFGLLTEDEQRQLQEYEGELEVSGGGRFFRISYPSWPRHGIYRAVRPVLTKPSINWDHVADEFIALATNENKSTWLYKKIPTDREVYWVKGGACAPANVFASFVPGTCDWRDSLVIRPGVEQ